MKILYKLIQVLYYYYWRCIYPFESIACFHLLKYEYATYYNYIINNVIDIIDSRMDAPLATKIEEYKVPLILFSGKAKRLAPAFLDPKPINLYKFLNV